MNMDPSNLHPHKTTWLIGKCNPNSVPKLKTDRSQQSHIRELSYSITQPDGLSEHLTSQKVRLLQ